MGWYITALIILILIVAELTTQVEHLKRKIDVITMVLTEDIERRERENSEVEHE